MALLMIRLSLRKRQNTEVHVMTDQKPQGFIPQACGNAHVHVVTNRPVLL
jgi:hypothetical protein